MAIFLVLVLGVAWAWHSLIAMPSAALREGAGLLREAGTQAATVARAFRQRTIHQEFMSSAVTLSGTTRLQVAALQEHETFRRKETDSLAWGLIELPSVVVQADMPVEYTYYLDFNAPWEFVQQNDTVIAYPPTLQPNSPAADVSKLTFYTLEGHLWQDDKGVKRRLQDSLTTALHYRSVGHIPVVKETARRQVETFVEQWLAQSFSDGHDFHVQVLFPDERHPIADRHIEKYEK